MTNEKVRMVVALYVVKCASIVCENSLGAPPPPWAKHLIQMAGQIDTFLTDGQREKAMRWLGFMQGVLWSQGVYTIEQMKEHNRP